jgi:uncharacterized protein (TIGR03118 family)
MKKQSVKTIQWILSLVLLTISFACQKNINDNSANAKPGSDGSDITPKDFKNFVQLNLVGNDAASAWHVDANLVNGWGIAFPPSGPAWVSSEGKGKSTIYDLDGVPVVNAVSIPYAGISNSGHPTGHVYNITSDFKLPNGNPAQFIFVTSDGTISGWNSGNAAIKKVDQSPSASYLGVTMANVGSEFFLYVANFAQNKIDVYDKNWNPVTKPFVDPNMPADYSPFNIETLSDGKIYVTYAKKNAAGKAEAGPGNGYINVFSPNGTLMNRFASKGKLDAPWGITKAPAGFWGEWSQIPNLILVANNGDGHINVFDENGNFLAPLSTKGKAVEIDGLWGITFPPITGLNRYYMYFAAGPNGGTSGLVGYIKNAYLN